MLKVMTIVGTRPEIIKLSMSRPSASEWDDAEGAHEVAAVLHLELTTCRAL